MNCGVLSQKVKLVLRNTDRTIAETEAEWLVDSGLTKTEL
jgi:hypothetical protein